MKPTKYIALLSFLLAFLPPVPAQEKLHVITRKVEQEFPVKLGDKLSLTAERGIIRIQGWEEPKIKVVLHIVAKNQDIVLAREDAGYMQYSMHQRRNELIIKNYLILPQARDVNELSSILRVEYEIWVPEGIFLDIHNRFGSVTLRELSASLNAVLDYSDITLQKYAGEADININIGDLSCHNSSLNATIVTRYSAVNVYGCSGELKLNMSSGSLQFKTNPDIKLDLTSDKTAVMLSNRTCQSYGTLVKADYTTVRMEKDCFFPEAKKLSFDESRNGEAGMRIDYKPDVNSKYVFLLNMRYGSLNLD